MLPGTFMSSPLGVKKSTEWWHSETGSGAHDDDRQLYEDTKRSLAARIWKHTQNYADAKSEVVHEILARARLDH